MKKTVVKEKVSNLFSKIKRLPVGYWLIISAIVAAVLLGATVLTTPSKDESKGNAATSYSLSRICELATLECFYHNVTEWSKEADWLGFGGKKLWIEYDGIIRVGIKADEIVVSEPDASNVITVTLPKAVILEKDLDENSIYEIDSERWAGGWIPITTSVTQEERTAAIAKAQSNMQAEASKNGMILNEARERAKLIIERNIKAVGEAQVKQYTVKFVDPE